MKWFYVWTWRMLACACVGALALWAWHVGQHQFADSPSRTEDGLEAAVVHVDRTPAGDTTITLDQTTQARLDLHMAPLVSVKLPVASGPTNAASEPTPITLDELTSARAVLEGLAADDHRFGVIVAAPVSTLQIAQQTPAMSAAPLQSDPPDDPPQQPGVLVPRAAIVRWAGEAWVYVQTTPDTWQRRQIVLDQPSADGWIVKQGVTAGERVVVTGAQLLLSSEMSSSLSPAGEERD